MKTGPVNLVQIRLGVRDLDASTRLYRDGCGLEVLARGSAHADAESPLVGSIEWVRLGRSDVAGSALVCLATSTQPPGRLPGMTGTPGPLGTGFTSSDIFEVHDRLSDLGARFMSTPLELSPEPLEEAGPRRFEAFGQTLDGEFVVLVERRNAPTSYGTIDHDTLISEPLHTSHVVEDVESCRLFMEQVLDHRVLFAENCEGELFERLMALPPGSSFRFQMLGPPDNDTGRIIFIEMERERGHSPAETATTMRGLTGLTYTVDSLDQRVAAAVELGVTVVQPPTSAPEHHLGPGRTAALLPPFDMRLELFEPSRSR